MAIDFPSNPALYDEFSIPSGRTWVWTGSTWKLKTSDVSALINAAISQEVSDRNLAIGNAIDAEVVDRDLAIASAAVSTLADANAYTDAEILIVNGAIEALDTGFSGDISALDITLTGHIADTTAVHGISDTANLVYTSDLANKQDVVAGVSSVQIGYLSGVTSDIQIQIDDKANTSHTHAITDVTNLTTELSGKADSVHVHAISDVTNLSTELSQKAAALHSHSISDVTNLQLELDGKSDTGHTHEIADIDNLQATLDGKAASTHTHAIADVTNLQTSLDAKANLAGATFTGDLEIPNVVITGNLLVQGTTTTINTTDYAIRDNIVYMNQAGLFAITNAVGNGTTVTYTAPNHDFQAGDYIVVTDVNPSGYNIAGTSLLTIDSVNGDDFVVTKSDTGTYVSGGMARGKSAANPDLGWAAGRTTAAGYAHTGVFRDASDATFKFFDGYIPEPDESLFIDTAHASFALAPIATSAVTTGNITATGTVDLTSATVSGISLDELSDVTETSSSEGDVLYHNGSGWINRYVNAIPVKTNTPTLSGGAYSVVASDAGKIVEVNNSGGATITIPDNETFAVGTQIVILQIGSGDATVSITVQTPASQTLNYSPGNKLRGQWAAATLLKRSSNTWVLYGDLVA